MAERYSPVLPQAVIQGRQDLTDDQKAMEWTIETTLDPSDSRADVLNRSIVYSDVNDELSRLHRIRETLRVRTSYTTPEQLKALKDSGISLELLENVEQHRLTTIAGNLGYDKEQLNESPMHKFYGQRMAKIGTPEAFASLAAYMPQLFGTKAFNQFISGVRSENPEWAKNLKSIHRNAMSYNKMEDVYPDSLSSVDPLEMSKYYGLKAPIEFPSGYSYTLHLARQLQNDISSVIRSMMSEADLKMEAMKSKSEKGDLSDDEKRELIRMEKMRSKMDDEGAKIPGELELPDEFPHGSNGDFAELVIDPYPLTKTVSGYLHRRKRSNFYGKRVMYPSRMLTDPYKRIFAEKVKAPGGVVVIDVSGSMSLEMKDVEQLLDAAPGALVLAYSHDGHDGHPNVTILADRGKQIESIPRSIFRGGNGVDGPALIYAIKRRHSKEPVIWVCDGMVTSSHDGMSNHLDRAVAALVLRYGIVQIPNVKLAIEQLKTRRFHNVPVGNVGDVVRRIRGGK